jgi:hypothetical protein
VPGFLLGRPPSFRSEPSGPPPFRDALLALLGIAPGFILYSLNGFGAAAARLPGGAGPVSFTVGFSVVPAYVPAKGGHAGYMQIVPTYLDRCVSFAGHAKFRQIIAFNLRPIMELLEQHWKAPFGIQNRTAEISEEPSSPVDRHLIIEFRKTKKESQRRFWSRFGVTQSRGSRFESGAEIPPPVAILLGLYLTKTVSDSDLSHSVIHKSSAEAFTECT